MNLTHFGSSFEVNHDVSASQQEVLGFSTRSLGLVEKPKRRDSFQNSIQSELSSFHFNMNVGSNNTFSIQFYASLNVKKKFSPANHLVIIIIMVNHLPQ